MRPDAEVESSKGRPSQAAYEGLIQAVEHAAHLLPAQGPIGVFIHHNTLHAFQHLKFEDAVVEAAQIYGAEPYMSEEAYRREVGRGRIQMDDIDAVLADEPDAEVWERTLRRRELRRRLLVPGLKRFTAETILWELEDGGLLDAMNQDGGEARALFTLCLQQTPMEADSLYPAPSRPRDGFLNTCGIDLDNIIHPWLIRLTGAFLDQGVAYWSMPNREEGFLRAVQTLAAQPYCLWPKELRTLPRRAAAAGDSAEAIVLWVLGEFGVSEAEWHQVIQAELLALPGWAGMMSRLEQEPELAPHERVPARLMDFLAVRMLLTISAADSLRRNLKAWRVAEPLSPPPEASILVKHRLAQAATFFDAIIQLGLTEAELRGAGTAAIQRLRHEIFSFDEMERRRVLHLAYERRHERQILLPLHEHRRRTPLPSPDRLSAQVFFCLDEREESIRRHLEEIAPDVETLGTAGFYGAAILYKGIDDGHSAALCPVVVKPQHRVSERPSSGHLDTYVRRLQLRQAWSRMMRGWSVSSRTLVRGWLGTAAFGALHILPMVARVLSPRRYAQLLNTVGKSVTPAPLTELAFERSSPDEKGPDGLFAGFTVEEKADRVASILGPAGLKKGMARLVLTLGHGSTSLNNPHESAHDCGACGGSRGGPNGRLFAAMANHPEVRAKLVERGIVIPDDTWFVGGYHDTCNDRIDLYDLHLVPSSHRGPLAELRKLLDQARALSAHERARRFEAAGDCLTARDGLRHVEARAEHLAEPRPEYGHCTNAVCVVGRRSVTRGLFLDRRAFLISYDDTQEATNDSLNRLLSAAIPVCGGISLEYYFSFVDNERYGCGTKLPHNITGLMGVMNGYESDLRTGLPWQMVEIHEPVRILFVIESTPERVYQTIRNSPVMWEFLDNRWIRVAVMDPATGAMQMYRDGVWEAVSGDDEELASTPSSIAWYGGRTEHLPMARIESRPAVAR